jgi:hypothetical protein
MRVNGNILLNTGLGLAVAYCAILAIWLGVESRTDHVTDMQPESFSPYLAVDAPNPQVVERAEPIEEMAKPGQSKKTEKKRPSMKAAVLQIVTNFEKADVTINGIPYPEYIEPGDEDGIVLPAGGPYDVRVTYSGKTKAYNIYLRPYETRMLIVELTGFQGGGTPPPAKAPQAKAEPEPEKKEETGKEPGKVTVYSKPAGAIIVDGAKMPEKTPGTVEVANGRHEVQVEYEGGKVSEKKIVRVRDGSRIKLFFRERTDTAE